MISKLKLIANTEDKKRLLSNFMSLSVLQVFTYVLPLLTLPYLVRVLGVDKFGLVAFAQAFVAFFVMFVDYGFNLSATREIAVHREDKEKVTEIFSSIMQIKFYLTVISFAIFSTIIFSFDKFLQDWLLYFVSFTTVIAQAFLPTWYFQGMERMKYLTIVNIVSRTLFTALIFIFIHQESDFILVPLLNGLGALVATVLSLWIVHATFHQKFKVYGYKTLKIYFVDSSQYFLSRVSVSIYTIANTLVLGLFASNAMVGYYEIANRLYVAMRLIYQPVLQALYPYVAKEKNIPLFKKIFYAIVSLNTLAIIILALSGSLIFDLLFTQKIGPESLEVFHILLMAAFIIMPSIVLGYPFLGALGYAKYANKSVIYASIFHILGLTILILSNNISIYLVAFLVVVTQTIDLLYRLYGIKKHNLWNMKIENIEKGSN